MIRFRQLQITIQQDVSHTIQLLNVRLQALDSCPNLDKLATKANATGPDRDFRQLRCGSQFSWLSLHLVEPPNAQWLSSLSNHQRLTPANFHPHPIPNDGFLWQMTSCRGPFHVRPGQQKIAVTLFAAGRTCPVAAQNPRKRPPRYEWPITEEIDGGSWFPDLSSRIKMTQRTS
jgi:hypothetical protein